VEVLIATIKPLFDGWAELLHLATACRVLDDDEVNKLCELCASVPALLRGLVTNRQIKTHMIEFEVPIFVRRWRSLGLFCEDAFESIHALMNRLKRRFACVRDRQKRDELMYKSLTILKESAASIAAIELKARRGTYVTKKNKAAAADAAAAATAAAA